ncbi:7001_t:CDS:1, partial [Scutellospora calospora]
MEKSKPGYYAVRVGRRQGIYLTWKDCKTQVNGFSNAKYKKFDYKDQAEQYIKGEKEIINIDSNTL